MKRESGHHASGGWSQTSWTGHHASGEGGFRRLRRLVGLAQEARRPDKLQRLRRLGGRLQRLRRLGAAPHNQCLRRLGAAPHDQRPRQFVAAAREARRSDRLRHLRLLGGSNATEGEVGEAEEGQPRNFGMGAEKSGRE